jgi:starch-binding outer membrane protein, SusD/RagB family
MKFQINKKSFTAAVVLTVAVMSFQGCKKFLDQTPITDVSSETVFNDVPSTYKALAGVYSRLMGDQGYGIRLSLYYPVDNDEMQGPTGAGNDNDRRDIARYSATPGNAQLEKPFNQLFQGIEFANICIDQIPKMDKYNAGSEQEKKQLRRMHGEALTLRAQFYLEAIRNWGDLPAHFKPAYAQASEQPFPSRTDRDSLYSHILEDLRVAEDLVPWRNELSSIGDPIDERITKGTVKGLRARIALFRGGFSLRQNAAMQRGADYLAYYQIARDECNDIINSGQHTLNPGFKALWKDQVGAHVSADPNGELMFQASAIGTSSAEDSKLGYYNGPTVNGFGNKSINPLPTYFYLFDSTDLRRDVTIAPYIVNADGSTKSGQAVTALNDGKYRRDWITNPAVSPTNAIQYFGLKWQILRYSDVLLMFAEAENELNGPTAAAYNAVNMVRRRGFGKPIATANATVDLPAGLTKAEFFKAIVRERALELGGEGTRKYDLIRWNLLATAIAETKTNLLNMSNLAPMVNYSYMAAMPSYSISSNLPIAMYYITGSTADDAGLWRNSFYTTAPTSTPSGTTKVTWLSTAINTTALSRYATGFTTGKSELLPIPTAIRGSNPNFTQNPGY